MKKKKRDHNKKNNKNYDIYDNEKYTINTVNNINKKYKEKTKLKKNEKYKIIVLFISLFMIIIFIFFFLNVIIENNDNHNTKNEKIINDKTIKNMKPTHNNKNKKKVSNEIIKKEIREELKNVKKFIDMILNESLMIQTEIYDKSDKPKISIVISVYNGDSYLKLALLSIQKQTLKDIEIIIVDDCSKDNSVNIIKELMIKDKRIILLQNEENRGILYTKTKGVLNAKGKYVMTLDEDDIYVQEDVFSTLYEEAEKNNLDILGFASYTSHIKFDKKVAVMRYIETPILHQPDVAKRMYIAYNNGYVSRVGNVIWNYFFRTDLFIKSIKQIDDKYFKVKMNFNDDYLLFFLLTRNAYNLKQIKRIFYLKIKWDEEHSRIKFRLNEKYKDNNNSTCISYLNYIEFLLMKTNNTFFDKFIASYELNSYYLYHKCRKNIFVREKGIYICKLFLENKYIENKEKKIISTFLNEVNSNSTKLNHN